MEDRPGHVPTEVRNGSAVITRGLLNETRQVALVEAGPFGEPTHNPLRQALGDKATRFIYETRSTIRQGRR